MLPASGEMTCLVGLLLLLVQCCCTRKFYRVMIALPGIQGFFHGMGMPQMCINLFGVLSYTVITL